MPAMLRLPLLLALVAAPCAPALAAPPQRAPAPVPAVTRPGEDAMAAALAGEFAFQAGRMPEAVRWYLEAARLAPADVDLAERAARMALLGHDDGAAAQALALWRQHAGPSLGMREVSANLALRQGRLEDARQELAQMLAEPGEQGWGKALLALSRGAREPAATEQVLSALVEDDQLPEVLQAWLAFGSLAQRQGLDALVQRMVATAAARFPDEPRVALLHAGQLRQSGRDGEAVAVLEGLLAAKAMPSEVRNAIAFEYAAMGRSQDAAAVLARGTQDNQTYTLRASLLARAKDMAGLAALYDEARRKAAAADPARLLLLGEMAQFLERPREALDWYQRVPGGPQKVDAQLRIASTYFELGRKDEAFDSVHRMQADASLDDMARQAAYLLESELRMKDKDDAGELDALARGLAAWPDDNAILYARALAWERRDDIARAEADLRRILATDPENTAALNALGYTLADRTERYQEALELIERARAAAPDDAAIIDSYGWVLHRLGRHKEALVELRRAYSLQKDAEIAAHLAQVLWQMGRRDEARKYFDESRGIDPENRSLLRALEQTGA